MLDLYFSNKFKKDYKRMLKRGADEKEFRFVVSELQNEHQLDEKYKDHPLQGDYSGFRECHINPDWLLVYTIDEDKLILTLTRTGTHSDLF